MKNVLIAMAVAVAACGLAAAQPPAGGMAPAAKQDTMRQDKKEAKKMKMNKLKGTVMAVDPAEGKITVKDDEGMTMVMPVTAGAMIMRDDKSVTLADVKPGEMVYVMYEGEMNMPMVKKIKIKKAHMKKDKMGKMEKMEKTEKMDRMEMQGSPESKPGNGGKK